MRIGLISDTHGLMRPEALRFLAGCEAIVHAGDIGKPQVLEALRAIAPLHAIRGNNDGWASDLPDVLSLEFRGVGVFVIHDIKTTGRWPVPAGTQVVVCGHSHQPLVSRHPEGFLLVNPGSAGPRRFKLPVTAAELVFDASRGIDARFAALL